MIRLRVTKKKCYCLVLSTAVFTLLLYKALPDSNKKHNNVVNTSRDYVIGDEPTQMPKRSNLKAAVPKISNPVNIFFAQNDIAHASFLGRHEVASLRTTKGAVTIYIHPTDIDTMISARVKQLGAWEEDLVGQMVDVTSRYQNITFIDVGCNIGVYTLNMADLGIDVVAVDPVLDNLRLLAMSLQTGKFHSKTTLIWNALSNEYKNVKIRIPKGNIGGAHVLETNNINGIDDDGRELGSAESVLLDDLIPLIKTRHVALKMDAEGHEGNVIQGASDFFQTFDVRVVQMEWTHHRYTDTGRTIVQFLVRNGLFAYEFTDMKTFLDPDKFYTWPENVFWIKR